MAKQRNDSIGWHCHGAHLGEAHLASLKLQSRLPSEGSQGQRQLLFICVYEMSRDSRAVFTETARKTGMDCRVELGRAYHKLGRRQEAWRELEAAVLLDVEDINAHLQKVCMSSVNEWDIRILQRAALFLKS